MAGKKRSLKMRYLLVLVGLAVFIVYLYIFVPFHELASTIAKLNFFYFFLAFLAMIASVGLYSFVWQRLMGLLSVKTSFLKAFQFVWVENFVDLVIPGEPVSGEVSRIYLMCKEAGGNYGKIVASAVGQRITSTCVIVAGLFGGIVYFALTSKPPLLVLAFAGAILAGDVLVIAALFYLASRRGSTRKLVNWLFNLATWVTRGRWKLEQMRDNVTEGLDLFHEGIQRLGQHRKGMALALVLTAFSWLLDISVAILVFLSLPSAGTAISISAIIIAYSISGAIQYLPIGVIPGEVGLAEIIMTSLFALLGNAQFFAVFAIATVLIRALTFWAKLLIGGIVVQFTAIESLVPTSLPSEENVPGPAAA